MTAPGRIVIAAYACCGPGEGTYAVTSTDGGATWGQPILAGTVQTDRGTGGPGPYSMTVQESTTNGVKTQVLSATGPQTTEVAVLDPNYWYPGGTAMVDSLVPAAAMTDLINTQVRVFNPSTGTSYGDPANWRPPQILPGEDEPSMASTAAAAYVMTHAELNGDALQDTYRVRKVNSDGTLGAPVQASDVGNVIFGRLAASPSGGLSTFWSTGGGTEADIMSSFSADGVTFQPARMLVENADSYDLAPAITSDGSGFVAWDDNAGSVWMTGIPAAVDANACRRELTVRTGVVARVSAGCWTKSGSSYKTKADVSINGIEFVTGSGPDTVTIDVTYKLTAGKGVVPKGGVHRLCEGFRDVGSGQAHHVRPSDGQPLRLRHGRTRDRLLRGWQSHTEDQREVARSFRPGDRRRHLVHHPRRRTSGQRGARRGQARHGRSDHDRQLVDVL